MAMAATRSSVLILYKRLLREAQKFSGYNYRMYAIRRIRDAFRENKNEKDPAKVQNFLAKAEEAQDVIRRQVAVGQLFKEQLLVIESTTGNQFA